MNVVLIAVTLFAYVFYLQMIVGSIVLAFVKQPVFYSRLNISVPFLAIVAVNFVALVPGTIVVTIISNKFGFNIALEQTTFHRMSFY